MKILVLGANGRTGRFIVRDAVAAGHTVRSFVFGKRSDDVYLADSEQYIGDVADRSSLETACSGIDVVISTLGHTKHSPADMQERAMKVLCEIAESEKFKIVSLTGSGVRVVGDKITLIDRIMNASVLLLDSKRVTDGKAHYEVIKNCTQPWVVIRVLKLTNRPFGNFKLTGHGPVKTFIAREQVAAALLQVATTNEWDASAPLISKL